MSTMTNPTTITAEPGVPFVDTVREFDAPVEALWRAHVEKDLVQRWLGPVAANIEIEAWDKTPGARYRYVTRSEYGEFGFNGVVHSVVPGERIIETFEFEPFPESVGVTILKFEDLGGGRSRLVARDVYPDVAARDGAIEQGMESGVLEGYERLDAVLASL